MPKPGTATAGMLSLLLLAACGSGETAAAGNVAAAEGGAMEGNVLGNSASAARPGGPADDSVAPVPPPDAVSHPDGFLPPAPAEPEPTAANSSDPLSTRPATEDEYIRNGQ